MGSYVESNLVSGETVKYRAMVSLWRYWSWIALGVLLLLGSLPMVAMSLFDRSAGSGAYRLYFGLVVAIVAALLIAWPLLIRRTTELAITDRRVIAKTGVLSTSSIEIRFEKIETVRVRQALVGRLLGYGDIDIRGTGSSFDPITNVANPMAFKANLDEAMQVVRR